MVREDYSVGGIYCAGEDQMLKQSENGKGTCRRADFSSKCRLPVCPAIRTLPDLSTRVGGLSNETFCL